MMLRILQYINEERGTKNDEKNPTTPPTPHFHFPTSLIQRKILMQRPQQIRPSSTYTTISWTSSTWFCFTHTAKLNIRKHLSKHCPCHGARLKASVICFTVTECFTCAQTLQLYLATYGDTPIILTQYRRKFRWWVNASLQGSER